MAQKRALAANCNLQGRAVAHFGSRVAPATNAKVYILYSSEYVDNGFRDKSFTHHPTLYTAGGVFSHRYIELTEHDKILKVKDKTPPTDEQALEMAERSIKYVDQALAETVDWASKHPKDAWTLLVITPDEQGAWTAHGLKPGSYDVIVRGMVSQLDAAWFFDYDVEPEKTYSLENQPRFFHPMKQ